MPNLLAMSFEGEFAPSFDLRCLHPGASRLPDGWGIGYYPGGEPSASILKEPAPPRGSIRSELIKAWEHLASSTFVLHIRAATWGNPSDANTQPFGRSYGRRDWMFAHSGSLAHRLETSKDEAFEAVGSTDTEQVFCRLLSWLALHHWTSLGDVPLASLRLWFDEMNAHGSLTCVLSDGRDLCVYTDKNDVGPVYLWQVLPPYEALRLSDDDLEIDLTQRGTKSRKGVIISSTPMARSQGEAQWTKLPPGHLVVLRQGAIRESVAPPEQTPSLVSAPKRIDLRYHKKAEVRRFSVYHRTSYRYRHPVERSTHLLRLTPAHDRLQTLLSCGLHVSVDGQQRDYEDVFGNYARRILLDTPYQELSFVAQSKVELLDTDPLAFHPLRARSTIPLVWMPWQRHMLQPFLLPPELPESELAELVEYGMSFVERNDYDLIDTLLDLNQSIFREYEYKQGATNVYTTPFEVYARRHGVCQDFANLFICIARLLGVPARYACGYIYTGPKHANQRQGEASHAWVQVYLPEVGWKGFDPTNGILTQTDHIRVAVGRSFVDATPTSGTIYVGGGGEELDVEVRVEVCD